MSSSPDIEHGGPWSRPVLSLVPEHAGLVPIPLTSMVGRETELATAQAMLQPADVRLLTLTGPGGIGKTRMAIQLATDLKPMFSGGVRFVPLEAVRDARDVPVAIAHAINAQPHGDERVLDALVRTIRTTHMLLVVDNFEHVVAAADLLTGMLSRCPRLKILVTSQVVLRITGEHTLAIPPLGMPDPDGDRGSSDPSRHAAIQLFAQRAQAADASFALTPTTTPWVVEICQRLDALPLAIELVAPRVRHLALPDLLKLLDHRLPLLTGGARDKPTRLQTMRNAIAWSHDLLEPGVQQVFRRLAVFTGGFTLAAAEWVVGDGRDGDIDRQLAIFDAIGTLVDASLLDTVQAPDRSLRYRMLETVREFALEQLQSRNEAGQARSAHALWFVEVARKHQYDPLLANGGEGMTLLDVEYPNLRAALEWLELAGDGERWLRLAAFLGIYWSDHGLYREGHAWLHRALKADHTNESDRACALVAFGMMELFLGLDHDAGISLTAGLAACRKHGHEFYAGRALIGLGTLAANQGDLAQSAVLFHECQAAAQRVPDWRLARIMEGWALTNLAMVSRLQGDADLADGQLETALTCMRDAGYTPGLTMVLGDLGDVARDHQQHDLALRFYREALGLSWNHRGQRVTADVVEAVAIVMIDVGRAGQGVPLLGAAEALRDRVGLGLRVASNQHSLDDAVARAQAALGQEAFAEAWSAGSNLDVAKAVALAVEPFPLAQVAAMAPSPAVALTPRESQIAALVAMGKTDAAIAASLFISSRTVENHVAHLLAKLGIHTRTDVKEALRRHVSILSPGVE